MKKTVKIPLATMMDLEKHLDNKNNPHSIEFEEAKDLEELVREENMSLSFGKIAKAVSSLISHLADKISHITKEEREQWNKATATSVARSLTSGTKVGTITIDGKDYDLYAPTNTDTKNTAGATDSSSKLFLVGATSQSANPQTYSQDTAYVGTDGCLYSGGKKTITKGEISSSAAITTQGAYALDAREKNASIDGTLAKQISEISSNLQNGLIDYKWILKEYTMDLSVENLQFKQELKSFGSKVMFVFAQLQYTDSVYSNKPFIFCNPIEDNNTVAITIMTEKAITESKTYKYYLLVALER